MKNKIIFKTLAAGGVGAMMFMATAALTSSVASAESASVITAVRVLDSCSIAANINNSTAHTATMVGGTVNTSIGLTAVDITCNDTNGYSVYAMGVAGDGVTSNTNLVGTTHNQTIPTGTNMSSNTSNWAMRLAVDTDSTTYFVPTILSDTEGSFSANHTIPATDTKVMTYTGSVDTSKLSHFTTTYAVAVSPYQTPDTYTGHVKYTLVHPNFANADNEVPTTINIVNGTNVIIDGVTYTNGQSAPINGGVHTISATIDTTNYHFVNWTGTNVTFTDANSETTEFYATGANPTITLNAAANCDSTISGTMQDFNPATLCSGVTSGTLSDSRDSKSYTVAKLADGKWWMTSNLNLAGGTVLSSDKSNVPSSNYYTLPASTAISSGTSVPSGRFSDDSTAYVFNTGNNTNNCTSSTPCNSYYSWLAAAAGGKDSSGNAVTANGYNAAYSICPKGWRLPTATTSNASPQTSPNWETGDWYQMIIQYMGGATSLNQGYYDNTNPNPFLTNAGPGTTPNFSLAGNYSFGSFVNGGFNEVYWSSTANSSTRAYGLYSGSSYVSSADNLGRSLGSSVRCVFGV